MSTSIMKRGRATVPPGRVVVGLILIALGIVILMQQAGYRIAGDIIGDWWPSVIVLYGIALLLQSRRAIAFPSFVILVGLALLAGTLELVPGGALALFWPVVLVVAGLSLLQRHADAPPLVRDDGNNLDLSVVFGGLTRVSHAPQFRSASLQALFGGITLDLRQAVLAPDGASINAQAAFGGVEIRVPVGWNVEISGVPIFGGYDSKALDDEIPSPDAPRLRVDATAVFGGVTVKH